MNSAVANAFEKGGDAGNFNTNLSAFNNSHAQQSSRKGPNGIRGFLVRNLPSIGAGVGAVAGIPLDIFGGVGSIAGGAAGGGIGEAIKRKILGQKEDLGQIGTQAAEGGVLAGPGKILKGAAGLAKGFITGGAKTAAEEAGKTGGSNFAKNLVTQGQQAQGRVSGISAGTKVGTKELTPQDTAGMLQTLKKENISSGNANNTLRDVTDKLSAYGKQIGDHFKTNNKALAPDEVNTIANKYLKGLKTTDPAVLDKATIEVNNLKKNVKTTEDLWKYRTQLDKEIPGSKLATDENLSNKIYAKKSMRQQIAKELGDVPGMKNYHALAEIKPFVSKEASRLNNPGGGIVGRLLASGPVQKTESAIGRATEKVGNLGTESKPITERPPGGGGEPGGSGGSPGAGGGGAAPGGSGGSPGGPPGGGPDNESFLTKMINGGPLPAKQVLNQSGRQFLGRGAGIPAAMSQGQQQQGQAQEPDISGAVSNATTQNPTTSDNPFSPDNVEANVQAILSQGGQMKDVASYLSNVKAYQALTGGGTGGAPGSEYSKPTAQQHGLAQSGLQSLQQLGALIKKDPSIIEKNATPGQGTPLIGSLVTNAAGAGGYHSLADNILSSLIHLQTGATATQEEITSAHGQLPQPGDSAEVRANKLKTLYNNFSPFLSTNTQ